MYILYYIFIILDMYMCFILKIIVNCIVFVIMEIELRKEIYWVVILNGLF